MILPIESHIKSMILADLIGFNIVEGTDGGCLIYHEGDFITKTYACETGQHGPVIDLYQPANLHLAWRAAAFGLLHYPDFARWWSAQKPSDSTHPSSLQMAWLDRVLSLAVDRLTSSVTTTSHDI